MAGKKGSEGQAAVEFAFVIILVFFTFVSLLELIFLMHTYSSLADAAKEGMRYAIVHGTQNSICSGPNITGGPCPDNPANNVKTAVTTYATASLHNVTASNVTVTYFPLTTGGVACNDPGCMVRVTVNYQYAPLFGMGWPTVTIYAAANGVIMN